MNQEGVGPLQTEASENKAAWKRLSKYKGGDGMVHVKKSSRIGKGMRESVSANIKFVGRERIVQEVNVPTGSCRSAAGPCLDAPVFPQPGSSKESRNQSAREM
jgi:hypothetical protein